MDKSLFEQKLDNWNGIEAPMSPEIKKRVQTAIKECLEDAEHELMLKLEVITTPPIRKDDEGIRIGLLEAREIYRKRFGRAK